MGGSGWCGASIKNIGLLTEAEFLLSCLAVTKIADEPDYIFAEARGNPTNIGQGHTKIDAIHERDGIKKTPASMLVKSGPKAWLPDKLLLPIPECIPKADFSKQIAPLLNYLSDNSHRLPFRTWMGGSGGCGAPSGKNMLGWNHTGQYTFSRRGSLIIRGDILSYDKGSWR